MYNYFHKFRQKEEIKIHIYALCWNEERMLPHFFRHYDQLTTRYFIFDNGSTDQSIEMLKANPKVSLGHFEVSGDSFVIAARDHYNQCWKQSLGQADWVIVCNIDEHIYHPNLKKYLGACKSKGVSLIIPKGYNMVADTFPQTDQPLNTIVKYGIRDSHWDKPQIFNPNKIHEMDFEVGRHRARPTGKVVIPWRKKVKLLHFKYLGLEYLIDKHSELRARMRARDIKERWGYQYSWDEARNAEEYQRLKTQAKCVF
jgi:hypothetical protein